MVKWADAELSKAATAATVVRENCIVTCESMRLLTWFLNSLKVVNRYSSRKGFLKMNGWCSVKTCLSKEGVETIHGIVGNKKVKPVEGSGHK